MEKESNYYYEPTIKTMRVKVNNANKFDVNDFIPKQQLISFLEITIKESKKKAKEYEQEREFDWQIYEEHTVEICQEVLDFVNKGGKDE